MPSDLASWRPRRRPDAAVASIQDDVLAFAGGTGRIHLMSATASSLWPVLDGTATVRELASDVAAVFGIEEEVALADIEEFVVAAVDGGLLSLDDDRRGAADAPDDDEREISVARSEDASRPRYLAKPPDP